MSPHVQSPLLRLLLQISENIHTYLPKTCPDIYSHQPNKPQKSSKPSEKHAKPAFPSKRRTFTPSLSHTHTHSRTHTLSFLNTAKLSS